MAQRFAARAKEHKPLSAAEAQALYDHVLARCSELLDDWLKIQQEFEAKGTRLVYNPSEVIGVKTEGQRLLYDPLHPDLPNIEPIRRNFRANRSMRDVDIRRVPAVPAPSRFTTQLGEPTRVSNTDCPGPVLQSEDLAFSLLMEKGRSRKIARRSCLQKGWTSSRSAIKIAR